jgi:hypothetical protein
MNGRISLLYALLGLMIVGYMYFMTYGDTDFTPNPVAGEFWCLKADRTDRDDPRFYTPDNPRLYTPDKVLGVQGRWVYSQQWYGDKQTKLWIFKVNRVRCKDQSDTAQPLH